MRHIEVVAAVIRRGNQILATQRGYGEFKGLWEFPGGKMKAGATALLAVMLPVGMVQKLLLASVSILFLHFFEEFGWPGGFPYMGVKILLGSDETDATLRTCTRMVFVLLFCGNCVNLAR